MRAGKLPLDAISGTVGFLDSASKVVKGLSAESTEVFWLDLNTPVNAEIKRLSDGVAKVLALPEVRTQLVALGLTVDYMTGEQLATREHAYTRAWTRIIKTSGFQPQ